LDAGKDSCTKCKSGVRQEPILGIEMSWGEDKARGVVMMIAVYSTGI